jgi:hypothetical protein
LTRIKVRLGQAEAEVEADHEHMREAIDLVPELASKLAPHRGEEQSKAPSAVRAASLDPSERPAASELPTVVLEKGDSLSDVIGKFFSDPWGRERRKLSDVREALQSYGLNYPKQSVAVALLRLAKTTRLRRFKAEDGEYVYTAGVLSTGAPLERSEQMAGELALPQPN